MTTKIQSKFALIIAIFGLLVISFSFYQWQSFIPQLQPKEGSWGLGQFPDPSQFFFGLFIGAILILYARNEWNKAREYRETKAWNKDHEEYHKKLTKQMEEIREEYKRVIELGNDVMLRITEAGR